MGKLGQYHDCGNIFIDQDVPTTSVFRVASILRHWGISYIGLPSIRVDTKTTKPLTLQADMGMMCVHSELMRLGTVAEPNWLQGYEESGPALVILYLLSSIRQCRILQTNRTQAKNAYLRPRSAPR